MCIKLSVVLINKIFMMTEALLKQLILNLELF